MALGLALIARVPADSAPLRLDPGPGLAWPGVTAIGLFVARGSVARPRAVQVGMWVVAAVLVGVGVIGAMNDPSTTGYAHDFLPAQLIYGTGSALMIAPLTTALMGSVPVARSGLASAINNAVSRVGPQLFGAVIFIGVTAVFYAALGSAAPQLDVSSPAVHAAFPPLNPPTGSPDPALLRAAREASASAFHLAIGLSSALLALGALVNAVGIRDQHLRAATSAAGPGPAAPTAGSSARGSAAAPPTTGSATE
jgi:hypothetical protein